MINGIVEAWVAEIEDDDLLKTWANIINARRIVLAVQKKRTVEQISDEMRRCKVGDTLYLANPIYFSGRPPTHVVYFNQWQPRAKRLWVCATAHSGRLLHYISKGNLEHYQPGRTDMKTRARAMVQS